jgi:phage terminase small subunit
MALHIETEMMLRDKGRIQVFKNDDGSIKYMQQVPYQSISDRALEQALKLASHFGLTPSSRTTIAQPNVVTNNTQYNFFD